MTDPRLPSPFELPPPDCEGWEEMYPRHALFSEDRRAFDESRFWFQESLHWPEPVYPFDALVVETMFVGIGQSLARLLAVPPALGAEYRLLGGYVYSSPSSVTDPALLARRAELFEARAGHYYRHWDELCEHWHAKVEDATRELQELEVPALPDVEDESAVTAGRGYGSGHELLAAYGRLLEGVDRVLHYHFELLNLGYGAYGVFYELCRGAFPDIPDQTIARMVSGLELLALRPEEELGRLAELALELGVAEAVKTGGGEERLRAALAGTEAGAHWLESFDTAKDPWFYVSYGNGLSSHHRSWIDDTSLPLATIAGRIERIEAGDAAARPREALAGERDRIVAEHRALLPEPARAAFDQSLALARAVFPHVEDHAFHVDHRYLTIFWNKVREFGALLAGHGFLADAEDVFHLRHDEVRSALEELRLWWSGGYAGQPRGPLQWPQVVARRRAIREAQLRWIPPKAVGSPPGEIADPVTTMLFGITSERIRDWLERDDATGTLTGVAAAPGVAEGRARLIADPSHLAEVCDGEILVAATTSPSWTPVFARVAGVVVDIGGIMCHAAIVAREYGLPTVVGTGHATRTIRTGDRVRVDGDRGLVTVESA